VHIRPFVVFAPPEDGGDVGAPETPDTPPIAVDSTPDGTAGSHDGSQDATPDWEARYKEVQAWSTRAAQEAAESRRIIEGLGSDDPQVRAWAAAQANLEFIDDEAPNTGGQHTEPDRFDLLQYQMQQLIEQQQHQQQLEQQQQEQLAYREYADAQMSQLGVPEQLQDLVAQVAQNMNPVWTPQGQIPDLDGAWQMMLELMSVGAEVPSVRQKVLAGYEQSKQAPHVSSTGQAGVQVPDLTDRSERQAKMVADMQASQRTA
jgi:hypothetical protein